MIRSTWAEGIVLLFGFLPGPGPCLFLLIQKKGQLSRPFKLSLIKLIIQRNA